MRLTKVQVNSWNHLSGTLRVPQKSLNTPKYHQWRPPPTYPTTNGKSNSCNQWKQQDHWSLRMAWPSTRNAYNVFEILYLKYPLPSHELMIAQSQIDLCKYHYALQLIYKIINPWQHILVLHHLFVEPTIGKHEDDIMYFLYVVYDEL